MRNQVSSMTMKANPTTPAATSTTTGSGSAADSSTRVDRVADTSSPAAPGSWRWTSDRFLPPRATADAAVAAELSRNERARAANPTNALTPQVNHNDVCNPYCSINHRLASDTPNTAPNVFTPYSHATARRFASSSATTARATAGSVAPMSRVGQASTTQAPSRRNTVAAPLPSAKLPPAAR